MKKICARCGKEKDMMSWETKCWTCQKEDEMQKIVQAIKDGEEYEYVNTGSSDYVICPYCGYAIPADLGYEDFPELYEEGGHEIDCPECKKGFVLESSCSWYYETRKKEE